MFASVGHRLPCAKSSLQFKMPAKSRISGRRWLMSKSLSPSPRRHSWCLLQSRQTITALASQDEADVHEAWELLKDFTAKESRGLAISMLDSVEGRSTLREALLLLASIPCASIGWSPAVEEGRTSEILIAVLASDVRLALRSLRDYCAAFNVPYVVPEPRVPNITSLPAIRRPVYIKYNSVSKVCYASLYDGKDRGVLLQLGSEQLGHFPLGLLDEAMARPPPPQLNF